MHIISLEFPPGTGVIHKWCHQFSQKLLPFHPSEHHHFVMVLQFWANSCWENSIDKINNIQIHAKYRQMQSMTCYLFWVAAPATPQPKNPPHVQPRATCFFDGRNLQPQLYWINIVLHIKACNFSFNFHFIIYWISQNWIFWGLKLL